MEDQMPFAVRVDIEGPVQLINRGATEAAMKHGYRPAHMDPPRVFASLSLKLYKPEEHCKSALSRGAVINHPPALVLGKPGGYAARAAALRVSCISCIPEPSGSASRSWRTPSDRSPGSG